MMKPAITSVFLNESRGSGLMELQVDFDNDRHHAVKILPPFGAKEFVDAMRLISSSIGHDKELR